MTDLTYTKQQYLYGSLEDKGDVYMDRFTAVWKLEGSEISSELLHLSSSKILGIYLESIKERFPDGVIDIIWFIKGQRNKRLQIMPRTNDYSSFLNFYSHPICIGGEEPMYWSNIPVSNLDRIDSSGFIQELTGWKPKPMQLTVTVDELKALVKANAAK